MINMIKIGQKAVISRNIPSSDGMLYRDTKVTYKTASNMVIQGKL